MLVLEADISFLHVCAAVIHTTILSGKVTIHLSCVSVGSSEFPETLSECNREGVFETK